MAELKTKLTGVSADSFIDSIKDSQVRDDCRSIADMMQKATKSPARMWGSAIVGFGTCRYKYASGREGEWMLTGFSPRKQNITLYLMSGFDQYDGLMASLGTHSCGKSCLYIKRLSDVHLPTLRKLIAASVKHMQATHPAD